MQEGTYRAGPVVVQVRELVRERLDLTWRRFYESDSAVSYGENIYIVVKFKFVIVTFSGFIICLQSKIVVLTNLHLL
jgi:hypothetical protein